MAITLDQLDGIADGNVIGSDGDKIGGIGQIYLDDNTGEPNWVTVRTGLFGTSETLVPLDGASLSGGDIVVSYDKPTVKDAPRVDADGSISAEEEEILYTYYSLGGTSASDDPDRGDSEESDPIGSDDTAALPTDTNYDAAGAAPTADADDTRGTGTRKTGRSRLRKYVVTENGTKTDDVTVTDDVQKEKVGTDVGEDLPKR